MFFLLEYDSLKTSWCLFYTISLAVFSYSSEALGSRQDSPAGVCGLVEFEEACDEHGWAQMSFSESSGSRRNGYYIIDRRFYAIDGDGEGTALWGGPVLIVNVAINASEKDIVDENMYVESMSLANWPAMSLWPYEIQRDLDSMSVDEINSFEYTPPIYVWSFSIFVFFLVFIASILMFFRIRNKRSGKSVG